MAGDFLFGARFTVADAYLFVMLRWANGFRLPLSSRLRDYYGRIAARDAVRRALAEEGLIAGGAPENGPVLAVPAA